MSIENLIKEHKGLNFLEDVYNADAPLKWHQCITSEAQQIHLYDECLGVPTATRS